MHVRNAHRLVALEDDARHPRIRAEVQVGLDIHDAMNVGCRKAVVSNSTQEFVSLTRGCVAAASSLSVDVLCPDLGRVRRIKV